MAGREGTALLWAGAALIIALVLLIVIDKVHAQDSIALVALLIVPLLVYALLSGRLQELKGPGGWGAKFQNLAHSSVEAGGIIGDAEPLQYVSKGAIKDLQSLVAALDPHLPRALILQVGRPGAYDAEAIAIYLKALLTTGAPTYVIFIR